MATLHLCTFTRFYTLIRPVADVDVVAGAVSAWRHWLNKELPHPLDWDESPTAPFDSLEVGEWGQHTEQLARPDIWLPGEHDFLFRTQDLADREVWIGSSLELLRDLSNHPAADLARRSVQFRLPLFRLA